MVIMNNLSLITAFYCWYEVEGFEYEGCIPFYDREASLDRYGAWNCTSSKITDHVKDLDLNELVLSFRNSEIYQKLCSKVSLGVCATTHQQWLENVTQELGDDVEVSLEYYPQSVGSTELIQKRK